MRFTLVIDNAFSGTDVPEMLRHVAKRHEEGKHSGPITDVQGHIVGTYKSHESNADRRRLARNMRHNQGMSIDAIARELNVSRATVFRYLKG